MSGLNSVPSSNKIYANIISDGTLRVKGEEGQPGVVRRDYETPSGEKGTKFEKVYASIDGKIIGVSFREEDFGKMLSVDFDCKNNGIVSVSMNTDQSFAQDFMKKLPNINLDKEVNFAPFSLDSSTTGKNIKGVSIKQDGVKIKSYFYDEVKKENINDFPKVEQGKVYDKDDWKIYFLGVKKFLIDFVEKNIIPKLPEQISEYQQTQEEELPVINVEEPGELSVEDIPFGDEQILSEEEKDEMIFNLIEGKFGKMSKEDAKIKAMEITELPFTSRNKDKMIEKLK